MVGRNLMFHTSDMIAINPRRPLSGAGPKKAISVNDFYLAGDTKLGTLQSVGVPVTRGWVLHFLRSRIETDPRWWRYLTRPLLRFGAPMAAHYFRTAAVFATIVEDLPYFENRVLLDPSAPNGMRFEYNYPDELRARNHMFRRALIQLLKPRHEVFVLTNDNNINYGHVCGTCRFGSDPATSVLDRNNRAHEIENLYVVDGSFFPSSGGTNPGLTIAANALRVAQSINATLRGGESTAGASSLSGTVDA
jgi:choline dehydrogenase-like flavoprotein